MPKHRVEVIDRTYAAILSAKTPDERVAIMDSMHRHARRNCWPIGSTNSSPTPTPEKRRHEYLRRLLGHGAVADLEARG